MATPIPGSIVEFHPAVARHAVALGKPLVAIVASVRNDRLVNLMVINANGSPFGLANVALLQDGDKPMGEGVDHAVWPGHADQHTGAPKPLGLPRRPVPDAFPSLLEGL